MEKSTGENAKHIESSEKPVERPVTPPNQMIPQPVCPGAPRKAGRTEEGEHSVSERRDRISKGALLGGKEGRKLFEYYGL